MSTWRRAVNRKTLESAEGRHTSVTLLWFCQAGYSDQPMITQIPHGRLFHVTDLLPSQVDVCFQLNDKTLQNYLF